MKKIIRIAVLIVLVVAIIIKVAGCKQPETPSSPQKPTPTPVKPLVETILIVGDTFKMGSVNGDGDESQVLNVTVSDFWMGKTEVTQGQWNAVMGNNPSSFTGNNNLPVEQVSWYNAIEFCNVLSIKEKLTPVYYTDENYTTAITKDTNNSSTIFAKWDANGYRLPTEAEWEYAAKGGINKKEYKYSGSDTIDNVAWYSSNSNSKTHEVGKKESNDLDLHDMSGNVSEWCWDYYDNYDIEDKKDPTGAKSGPERVHRGGGFGDYGTTRIWEVTYRDYDTADHNDLYIGFRVARTHR